ncbi:hypothetical protein ACLOJK_035163, partial [Asimina triloba]
TRFAVHRRSTSFGAPSPSLRPAAIAAGGEIQQDVQRADPIHPNERRRQAQPLSFVTEADRQIRLHLLQWHRPRRQRQIDEQQLLPRLKQRSDPMPTRRSGSAIPTPDAPISPETHLVHLLPSTATAIAAPTRRPRSPSSIIDDHELPIVLPAAARHHAQQPHAARPPDPPPASNHPLQPLHPTMPSSISSASSSPDPPTSSITPTSQRSCPTASNRWPRSSSARTNDHDHKPTVTAAHVPINPMAGKPTRIRFKEGEVESLGRLARRKLSRTVRDVANIWGRCAEKSPPFVHIAGSSRDGDSDNDLLTDSTSKSANFVSRSAAEPVTLRERIAADAVVPNNDDGSGDNSSVTEVIMTIGAEAPHACSFFLSRRPCQQKVSQLVVSMEEDECQHLFALEAEKRLFKECDAEVAIIDAAKARMAKIDTGLVSYKKVVEEREAIMKRNSLCLREVELRLVSSLSYVTSIEEAELAPPCLTHELRLQLECEVSELKGARPAAGTTAGEGMVAGHEHQDDCCGFFNASIRYRTNKSAYIDFIIT